MRNLENYEVFLEQAEQLFSRTWIYLGAAVLIHLTWHIWVYPTFASPFRCLPSIKLFAGVFRIWKSRPYLLQCIRELPSNGLVYFYDSLFGQNYIVPCSHAAALEILGNRKDYARPQEVQSFFAKVLGYGVLTTEGERHHRQRRLLGPAFGKGNLLQLHDIIWMQTTRLLHQLQMQVEAGLPSVEITDIIHRYSVDIITLLSVGQTSDSAVRPNLISMSINEVLEPAWAKLGTLFTWMFLPWLTVLMPPRARAKIKNSLDILRLYCTDIIRNSRSNSAVTNQEQAYLLSTALASKELSEDEIIDHMMTTMIAGSESSFNSIVRCCYLLCRDQALQARLRTEIRTHLPPIDRAPISPGKLASLPLLHGVCEETLRLHPAVPTTLRFATRDTSVQGKHIPKGTKIVVDFYALNRMTNTWGADSDAFVPERWLADESQEHRFFNRQGRPHLSFSWGNHNCIGVEVGRAEMRCAIAGLIGRFAMELVKPDLEFKEAGMIGMRSVDKIDIRITPIEGW